MAEEKTEQEASEQFDKLLTTEFLSTLLEVSKLYGWSGDYVEIAGFVESLHSKKGIEIGAVQCYEIIYKD